MVRPLWITPVADVSDPGSMREPRVVAGAKPGTGRGVPSRPRFVPKGRWLLNEGRNLAPGVATMASMGLGAAALMAAGIASAPVWVGALAAVAAGLAAGATLSLTSRVIDAARRPGGLGNKNNRATIGRGMRDDGALVVSSVVGGGFARVARFGRLLVDALAGAGGWMG